MALERVLADIDANYGDCSLSVWDMACSLSWRPWPAYRWWGQEHGRTIPLPDMDATVRTHSLLLFENRPIRLTRITVHLTFELDRDPQASAGEAKRSFVRIADRRTGILPAVKSGCGAMGRPRARNFYRAAATPSTMRIARPACRPCARISAGSCAFRPAAERLRTACAVSDSE